MKSENLAGTATLSALSLPTDTSSTQPKSLRRVRLQPPTLRTGVRGRQFNRQRGKCSRLLTASLLQARLQHRL